MAGAPAHWQRLVEQGNRQHPWYCFPYGAQARERRVRAAWSAQPHRGRNGDTRTAQPGRRESREVMINFTNWRARAPTQVWPPTAVQDLYGYLPVTVPSISSAACLIAFSLWDYAHHRALTLWLCAMLLVQLLRTVLLFAFRHSSQADQALPHWTWVWIFTASCTGALLGFANTYFFAPIPVVELVLATLTAAFVGSGWSVVAPSIVALILYVSLPLIPLAIQFALVGNRGEGVVAFALAAMVVACIAFGLRWRHMYFESLSREAALEDARRAAE